MNTTALTIFWFRQDLRISDNPGLVEAAKDCLVLPIYIQDDDHDVFKIGGASRWWLHQSLDRLSKSLDNKLNFYTGNTKEILLEIIQQNNIKAVYWNRRYTPHHIKIDVEIKAWLKTIGIECTSFCASLLWEPWTIKKSDATPYKVYTPFYRKACGQGVCPRDPLPKPEKLWLVKDEKNINTLDSLQLLPRKKWYEQIESHWNVGEVCAQEKLVRFMDKGITEYKENRNYPNKLNVSQLSPYLHFGEISPHQVWRTTQDQAMNHKEEDVNHFLSEIGWREFSYYLLYHFPDLPCKNFQAKFDQFPWRYDKALLEAWQKGQTGYPIVDAGMRQLWQIGYMHNRVRMIVASFLVKNLLLHWHYGQAWFWDCLVDADLANNSASWQWVAGCGADAAPYFRIFNPITQGEKFDPDGLYTRHFVPELSRLPNRFLFKPWTAPHNILKDAGVFLGENYPRPIINLEESREQAMNAYQGIKNFGSISGGERGI